MKTPVWIPKSVILAIHEWLLAEHGGRSGLRDEASLESAQARPNNIHAYNLKADLHDLAAAYASGIVRNHPFVDGNKRTGFMVAYVFLARNGRQLVASEAEATHAMISLAAGEMEEEAFSAWLRENTCDVEGGGVR